MIALLQRVSAAQVVIQNEVVAKINQGIVALIGIEKGDGEPQADRLVERLLGYRIFSDHEDKMNLGLNDIKGSLLLVPQFTLAANTDKGMRPSFSSTASPADGEFLFNYLCKQARREYSKVESGRFGADMKVSLTNDGPVTFWLQVRPN